MKKIMYKKSSQAGFTFIELLISMMIIMLIGSIILVVFFSALRGTNRSQSIITLRQNGNYALSQMTKDIRQAASISNEADCTESETDSITIVSATDYRETTYQCSEESIASVSASQTYYLLDSSDATTVSSCAFSCGRQEATELPFVKIRFTLTTPQSDVSHTVDPFTFSSTVTLRNAAQ